MENKFKFPIYKEKGKMKKKKKKELNPFRNYWKLISSYYKFYKLMLKV